MWPAYWLSMAVLAMFTLGLWTRATSILAFLVTVSYIYRVPAATFGLDQINAMLALYLAIGPSGEALSIDRWRAVRRGQAPAGGPTPSAGANLALRLINVHMCVIYFFAGISKLQGEAWWNGEAMWRAFANLEYQSIDMTWLAWHPEDPRAPHPRLGPLGALLLCADLAAPPAAARAGRCGPAARGDRRLPRDVDVRADHAGRLRVVPARGGDRPPGAGDETGPPTIEAGRERHAAVARTGRLLVGRLEVREPALVSEDARWHDHARRPSAAREFRG